MNLKIYTHTGLLQNLGRTVGGRMQAEFWSTAMKEHLREFIYMAQMASLELEISVQQDAVSL